jgi:DNA-binding Lrp family transcriptional regulator
MSFLPLIFFCAKATPRPRLGKDAVPAGHLFGFGGPARDAPPPCQCGPILLDCGRGPGMRHIQPPREGRMVPFFVQIKCNLGKSYDVANALAESEIASEIYSTAGDFDLLVKFYVEKDTDIGHFVTEKVQTIPGIQDTRTIITFKAF